MIICDSREKKNEHILAYFSRNKIPYKIEKIATADYMVDGKDKLVVDRKQNLEEVCSNLTYRGKTAAEHLEVTPLNGYECVIGETARKWMLRDFTEKCGELTIITLRWLCL